MTRLARPLIGALLVASLVTSIGFASARSAFAYGKANYQVAFNGTGVVPGTGVGFGFWGWCEFAGGVTSGNDGDCEFSQYFHSPTGNITCEVSLDISAWDATGGTFVITGTASVNPSSLTGPCVAMFPGSTTFTGVDSMIPAAPGHYPIGSIGGAVGEFNIQVTLIPS